MKNPKSIIFIVLTTCFLGVSIYLSYNIIRSSSQFVKLKTEYAETRSLNKRLLNDNKWYNLFNPIEGLTTNLEAVPKFEDSKTNYNNAIDQSIYLAIASIAFFVLTLLLFLKEKAKHKYLATSLVLLCLIFLVIGIFSPMMELGVYMENVGSEMSVQSIFANVGKFIGVKSLADQESILGIKSLFFGLKGDTYVFFQMKSIFSVIKLLFKQGNIVVGTVILLFSVVTPLLKIIFSFLCLYTPLHRSKIILFFIHKLSKWSMLDVFVVAIFMAFLSYKNMDTSGAEVTTNILMGGYYFLSFVLISIISSYLIDASIKYRTKLEHHRD